MSLRPIELYCKDQKKEKERKKNFHSQTCGVHLEFHSWFTSWHKQVPLLSLRLLEQAPPLWLRV